MNITTLSIPDIILIEPQVFSDDRGFFFESFNEQKFQEATGVTANFIQDNHSQSTKGVLRGLHYQLPPREQGKLVRVVSGEVFDVAVDIRRNSPTFGQWESHKLTAENGHQLYVPVGFAHGFVTLEPDSEIVYKCTDYYAPETEGAVHWSSCGIDWPLTVDPILSDKDMIAPAFTDFVSPFIYGQNS